MTSISRRHPLLPGSVRWVAIYALGERTPAIDSEAYIHPEAVVIGDVVIGPQASVWPCAVLRGDYGSIRVGAATSVQDGAVLHATAELATVVGRGCVIGHLAHLEGCVVEDESLVGTGSIVLHRAVVGKGATVGAGAVVTNDTVVPAGALAVGVPAIIKSGRSSAEGIELAMLVYVDNAQRYRQRLRRLD